jgi:methylated-DNA-protein-cysteine methyltransferase-like protein
MEKSDFAVQVYELVKKIPKGKVATYGQIAKLLGRPKASRAVGNILHHNSSSKIPCHRVVNKEGRLAFNFAHGGLQRQREILKKEGIKFKDNLHVILKKDA